MGRLVRRAPSTYDDDTPVDATVPRTFDLDGIQLHPVPLTARRGRALLRGLLQRAACGRSTTTRSRRRSTSASGGTPTCGSTSGSPTRPPRSPTRAPPCGCRTTSCSWCRRCSAPSRPDLRIGFFLHIPFPPVELFMQLPRRVEILRGLLGADLVGFQRPLGAQNFLRLTRHLLGPAPARQRGRGRRPRGAGRRVPDLDRRRRDRGARDQPARSASGPSRSAPSSGNPKTIILGVDRLDYTKGIERPDQGVPRTARRRAGSRCPRR